VSEAYGSYASVVAELSVSEKNVVDIKRLVLGIDCGHAVNPDNGRVEQTNFHDHRMMRLREMPKVEVLIAPSGGFWGRHQRAGAGGDRARGGQCHLRRHRQAHPQPAAQERGLRHRVKLEMGRARGLHACQNFMGKDRSRRTRMPT
jgi:hypothetical protein